MIMTRSTVETGGYRHIWRVAYPLILTHASHTTMQFVDRKFLSLNSTLDVAAAAPAGILFFTFISFFMVTANFTSTIVAQHHGRDDSAACARSPWSGFYFSILGGLVLSFLYPWAGRWLIELGGHPEPILAREKEYLSTLLPGGGFACAGAAFCCFFSGRGKTWYVTVVHSSACVINIVLDYVLIFGKFGFPKLGITGAGVATSLGMASTFVIAFLFFIMTNQETYPTRSGWRFHWEDLRRLLGFGAPCGFQVMFEVASFTLVVFLIGRLGGDALAATTIALSINMISFLPLLGLSEATGIVVGNCVGANQKDVVPGVAGRSWRMAAAYMTLMAVLFIGFPDLLINVFAPPGATAIDFDSVRRMGRGILICAAIFNFFDATVFVFSGALRGAGDTSFPMWAMIIAGWGFLAPGASTLIFVFNVSAVAVWAFIALYIFLLAMVILFRFRSGAWRDIEMIDPVSKAVAVERTHVESEARIYE